MKIFDIMERQNLNYTLFIKQISEKSYIRLIYSILRTQAELILVYKLPASGGFIYYEGGCLVWDILGQYCNESDVELFNARIDKEDVKQYAIKSLKKNQILKAEELRKLYIEIGESTKIKIRPMEKEDRIRLKKTTTISNENLEKQKDELVVVVKKSLFTRLKEFIYKILLIR